MNIKIFKNQKTKNFAQMSGFEGEKRKKTFKWFFAHIFYLRYFLII